MVTSEEEEGSNATARTSMEDDSTPFPHFDKQSIKLEGDEDPRNWSAARKWSTTAIISLMGFISPLGSSVVVPGSSYMDRHFDLASRELALLPVSFFVLGLGVGPFLLAPASELKGRRPIFVISSCVFVLFNIATAVVNNFGALCFLRFMAGAAGSTGPSLGAGTIGDVFAPRERGRAQSLYGLGPLLGPVCGTIAGGWLSQSVRSWRWLLWFLTILSAVIAIIVIFFLRETYAPVLTRQKVIRLAKEYLGETDIDKLAPNLSPAQKQSFAQHRSEVVLIAYPDGQGEEPAPPPIIDASDPAAMTTKRRLQFTTLKCKAATARIPSLLLPGQELRQRTRLALSRPFRLLFLNPICAIFSLYMGYIYGIIFIFITQHPLLFERRDPTDEDRPPDSLPTYGWSPGFASLTYLGLGLGFLVAASVNVLLQDAIYARLALSGGRIGWWLFSERRDVVAEMNRHDRIRNDRLQQERQRKQDKEAQARTNAASSNVDIEKQAGAPVPSGPEATPNLPSTSTQSPPYTETAEPPASIAVAAQPTRPAVSFLPVAPVVVKGRPEYRLPLCLVGMLILPCGLLVFGWTADSRTHFMLPLLGSFLVGVGSILPFQAILVYLVDAFIPYSASATACAVLVRCTLAAVFPLFSEKLFVSMGFGWGSTLLALVSALAIPVPIFLYTRGESIRLRFRFDG